MRSLHKLSRIEEYILRHKLSGIWVKSAKSAKVSVRENFMSKVVKYNKKQRKRIALLSVQFTIY